MTEYGLSMNPIKIRKCAQKDFEAIVKIYNEAFQGLRSCWPNPMMVEWFTERFGPALASKTGTAFLAIHDEMPIGYVLVTSLNRHQVGIVALISGICITPAFQRKRVGSTLLKKAIDWAKKQGAVLIENDDEIIENPIAVSFFEKLGLKVFHRGAYMSRNLASVEASSHVEKQETRELKPEDLDQLLGVRREAFREFGPWYSKPDGEAFKQRMKNRIGRDDVKVFVATMRNRVVGYIVCCISEIDRTKGDIRNISVLPEFRNLGIGTALANRAFDFLKMKDVISVETATETAEGFYKKVGFKVDNKFVRVRKHIRQP